MRNDKVLRIYTDGGCSGNQESENFGGWGAILEFYGHRKELYGGEANTTNNRMEMTALLEACKAITKQDQRIEVFSDSAYLMDCFRKKWYENWLKNDWKNSAKRPVENRDLWEALLPYLDQHSMSFFRVKGHVNLKSKTINFQQLYEKFTEWNGPQYTFEEFQYITEQNNHADQLANLGIKQVRP